MAGMNAESIDLTVTSPPYDNLRDYKGFTFDYKKVISGLYRITKPGGVVVWVVNDATIKGSETGTSFRQALFAMECGFNLHDTMIYKKTGLAFPDNKRYYQIFEYMFIFSKGAPLVFNQIIDRQNVSAGRKGSGASNKNHVVKETGARFNVWEIPNTDRGSNHPAPFPLALARDHVLSWSNDGDTVFDPFLGSGTTGAAALTLGRDFIGCDISPEYVEIARKRIEETQRGLFT